MSNSMLQENNIMGSGKLLS